GNVKVGIDLEQGACKDVSTLKIWDLYTTKYHALKYAADAVCTVLRVDQHNDLSFHYLAAALLFSRA
nr:T-complex protein 1 subunit theta [Tanacetum cinerariifolium]